MRIDEIEGIGATYAAKLGEAGVSTTDDLLLAGWIAESKDQPNVVEH